MNEVQKNKLFDWLLINENKNLPKFIVTPSVLLPRHSNITQLDSTSGAIRSDAWDGFPKSFHDLLAYIAMNEIKHVVFLSGDEHISCITKALIKEETTGHSTIIHSIHSSALYAPFPFANSIPEDLALHEEFNFISSTYKNRKFRCTVESGLVRVDNGFMELSVEKLQNGWKIYCDFDGMSGNDSEGYEIQTET